MKEERNKMKVNRYIIITKAASNIDHYTLSK